MDDQTQTDVIDSSSPAVEASPSSDASSAPAAVQGESQAQSSTEQSTGEAAAPFQVPENDDDLKGQENNPHVQAIVQLRQELRARNQVVDSYKPLDDWKPVVEAVGDPTLAQSAYELISAIHTPSEENPSRFTTVPFLNQIEEQSPGTINQMFSEMLAFQIADEHGQPTTVVRELYKAHGLNPDRIDEYRNIDNLRASGIVTEADLGKIPEQYRDAFKSMSQAAREDLLDLIDTKPLVAEEQLRNAQQALEIRQIRERDEKAAATKAEADQRAFEQQVREAVETDVTTKIQSWSNSIHQNLSSQWKPSTDDAANSLEYAKVLSTLATLQHPGYRFIAEGALKAVGASLEGFDDLVTQWQDARSRYVTFNQMKDTWQAKRAESDASRAEQRILIKLNDYALKLAQVGGNRLAAQAQQTASQVAAASARFVPNGNGNTQEGFQNPYEQNPYQMGTQEYREFNKKIDREYGLTHGAMFNG